MKTHDFLKSAILLLGIACLATLSYGGTAELEAQPTQPSQPAAAPAPRADSPEGMALVPAGKFTMGCVKKIQRRCDDDEQPPKEIYLDAFYMDVFEVTNEKFQKCVATGACARNAVRKNFDGPNQPVGGVNWFQANAYCSWAGKRLPTEAEWEKAARGSDARTYPWGNEAAKCDRAVMFAETRGGRSGCGRESTWDVGSKPDGASPYGIQDMGGNVWEWVYDWYSVDYYEWGPSDNPKGPPIGQYRGFRGGSYETIDYYLRTTYRVKIMPEYKHHYIGFRCAQNAN